MILSTSGLPNDADAFQAKERGGGEAVAVIGIDFLEAMFGGTSKMQGVGGAEENRAGIIEKKCFHPPINRRVQRQPENSPRRRILLQLGKNTAGLLGVGRLFTDLPVPTNFPVPYGDEFRPAMKTAGDGRQSPRQSQHFRSSRLNQPQRHRGTERGRKFTEGNEGNKGARTSRPRKADKMAAIPSHPFHPLVPKETLRLCRRSLTARRWN